MMAAVSGGSAGTVFAYSTDRSYNMRLRTLDNVPSWAETRWHRCRPDDEALAACNRSILLNTTDKQPAGSPLIGILCRRCFPTRS